MATWLQLSAKKMVSTFQEGQTKRKIRITALVSMQQTFEPLRIKWVILTIWLST